jgi:hypothetical protein
MMKKDEHLKACPYYLALVASWNKRSDGNWATSDAVKRWVGPNHKYPLTHRW